MEILTKKERLARSMFEKGVEIELGTCQGDMVDASWQYFRRGAILGDRQAQFFLSVKYASISSTHKYLRLAVAWFRRAALAGEDLCTLVSHDQDVTPEELVKMFQDIIV